MNPSVMNLQHRLVLELSVGLSFDQKQTEGKNGGHVPSTDWTNQGEFEFSFWASLCADDAALHLSSLEGLLAATNAIHKHLRLFGLLMHVGAPGKKEQDGGHVLSGAG